MQNEILSAFNLNGEINSLHGGQNTSVRVKDAVLKPVGENEQIYEWALTILNEINPHEYRLSKPIISNNNTFVYKGWCCTRYEPGEHRDGNVKQKLEVSRLFHSDLAEVDFVNIPKANDPWSISQRIAWQKENLPSNLSKEASKILDELISKIKLKENYKLQIIHADLSGNILFDKALNPLIIDFSPTIAPVKYAEAILVCDCIAWQGSPISEIGLICCSKNNIEMILRAVIFRLSVAAIFAGNNYDTFVEEYQKFKPIIDYVNRELEYRTLG
ncbi:hypothetical protein Ana3638_01075 [Anaerocolumna sedimenticola]|uniref:non-specific serine/threonine protein kinase n=1 Tax=Anaerocolumna sedimenticola TaxID=2696063 RepID=A0A6P1THQ3_9FIRM|nr:RIO1 family regulatory kinase/ATPase [Anaerocolumna sedimenticola]QHQ59561.1 hypothetical protein Ana3638_01075 [Anaerocolumna sedimenticola]